MSRPLALDLFCGAGGAAMGLHRAGFDVVGIDIKPQPRYPFPFIRGDALNPPVRLSDFDLIWASPPCQGYSRTRHLPWLRSKKHPLLIPAMRDMLQASGIHYCIENVGDAPLYGAALTGDMFGMPFTRLRRFETSFLVMHPKRGRSPEGVRGRMFGDRLRSQHERLRLWQDRGAVGCGHAAGDARDWMDCRWMGRREASQAIPPAYSEHIGRYAMMAIRPTPSSYNDSPTPDHTKT